jgi:hypothetical protein
MGSTQKVISPDAPTNSVVGDRDPDFTSGLSWLEHLFYTQGVPGSNPGMRKADESGRASRGGYRFKSYGIHTNVLKYIQAEVAQW